MDGLRPAARAALVDDADWEAALQRALRDTGDIHADAVLLFAGHGHAERFPDLLQRIRSVTGAPLLVGCSGTGIIGPQRELERTSAIALLALSLPGATLRAARFTQGLVAAGLEPEAWPGRLGVPPDDVNAWLVFADPFRLDGEGLITALGAAYPGRPVLGGLASAGPLDRRSWVFLNGDVYPDGGVGLAIGGRYGILPLVSQGCEPIGAPWTITGVQDHWIGSISNRPAVDVLIETVRQLPEDIQARAQRNLVVGLAADEYRHDFARGDFLIRNLAGIDRGSGAIAVGALPRLGQTIQFQMRDAATADLDLNRLLDRARSRLAGRPPIAAVLCSCTGRGAGLFGTPHHDANAVARKLGPVPLAGLFCDGEIGPIGDRTFLHGFTASLALIVREA